MLGSYNCVNVVKNGQGLHCSIKKCKRKCNYSLFVDDGNPSLSRLYLTSCSKHLILNITKAWKYNRDKKFRKKVDD
jgi:hypothetical protein